MNNDTIVKTVLEYYPDVEAIYLFGTYGTEEEWPESDVDVALLFPHARAKEVGNLALSECGSTLIGLLKKDVDLINLRMVNTVFHLDDLIEFSSRVMEYLNAQEKTNC